jgi:fluoride ion exporter CrcB/FEX
MEATMTNGSTASHRRPWVVIAAFSVVGPLIGLIALMLGLERDVRIPLQNVTAVVFFAYLLGTLPAVMSGVYVVLRNRCKGAIGNFEAFSVSGLVGAVTTFTGILISAQHPLNPANLKTVFLVACISAVSGMICNRLTRRWQAMAAK